MSGGHGPQRKQHKLPSGIIHTHLIIFVMHEQAHMCLQSDPKCYEQISTKFEK